MCLCSIISATTNTKIPRRSNSLLLPISESFIAKCSLSFACGIVLNHVVQLVFRRNQMISLFPEVRPQQPISQHSTAVGYACDVLSTSLVWGHVPWGVHLTEGILGAFQMFGCFKSLLLNTTELCKKEKPRILDGTFKIFQSGGNQQILPHSLTLIS